MLNIELMDKVIAQIEAHPETWDQTDFRCDTGMCFAGWACDLSGVEWADSSSHRCRLPGETMYSHCSAIADDLLGLEDGHLDLDDDYLDDDYLDMYDAGNDLGDLKEMVEKARKIAGKVKVDAVSR